MDDNGTFGRIYIKRFVDFSAGITLKCQRSRAYINIHYTNVKNLDCTLYILYFCTQDV